MGAAIDDASADVCLARLSGGGDEPDYEQLRRDSTALLTSAGFAARSPAWQADAIWTVFMRMVSALHADAGVVAASAALHFGRLLDDPRVGVPEACRMFDALWGMWWCAASSLDDMRPVYPEVCIPFHRFLARRGLVASDPSPRDERAGPLRIGYLLHYAHGQRGNAVAPLVVSLARAHAVLPDRKVFVYATQWVDEDWLAASFSKLAGHAVETHSREREADHHRGDGLERRLLAHADERAEGEEEHREFLRRSELQRELRDQRRHQRDHDDGEQRADEGRRERRGQRLAGLALLRHRMAVEGRRHRPRLARDVEQDRGDGAAEQRAPIDAGEHDDCRGRRHAEGERQQDRDAVGAAEPRQHADEDAEHDAQHHHHDIERLKHDGKAVKQIDDFFHCDPQITPAPGSPRA